MNQMLVNSDISVDIWNTFVKSHPNGNIFQSPEIYDLYSQENNHEPIFLAAKDEQDNIKGILLAVIQKEYGGLLGKLTSRSIITGGPLAERDDPEIIRLLLKAYLALLKDRAIYTQVRNLHDTGSAKAAFESLGFSYEPHLDIHIRLNQGQENLLGQIHKSKKRNLTKSTNKGTVFTELTRLSEYEAALPLVYKTYKRIGLPAPGISFFMQAFKSLHPNGMLHAFAAVHDGKTIGLRIELTYKDILYDWYAGSDDNAKNKYPNDFLPYHILLWGKKNGFNKFDFGGAGKPDVPYGVRDHKMKFGGELIEYGRYLYTHSTFRMKIGKIGLKMWKLFKFR